MPNLISVIIPNYNGKYLLETCLPSLMNQTYIDFKITVIDNGSKDSSVEYLKSTFPEILVIDLKYNFGFSKAVNIGIKKALENPNVTHIVLLNNDVECENNFLEELMKGFISDDIGSVCPKMLNYFDRNLIDDAGDIVTKKKFPNMRGRGETDIGQYDKPEFVFGACAGAATYKREVFENIGFFDEDYFAFLEDIDFNFRLQYSGYKCYYHPDAVCYHKRGATISANKPFHIFLLERNIVALRIKNFPFSVLIKYSLYYQLHRLYRFNQYLINNNFKTCFYAFKGYLFGVILWPKWALKRKKIMSKKVVSFGYIKSLMD